MDLETDKTVPRQERRVAAWIYAVINPILEGLEREFSFLERGNLTWRASTKRCEYIRNIQEYVDSNQWPNYKDFLMESRSFAPRFNLHDSNLSELNSGAQEVYKSLVAGDAFSKEVEAVLAKYEEQRPALGPQYPSYNNVRKELAIAAAESVVNNVRNLPDHYLYSYFWNSVGKELLSRRELPIFDILNPMLLRMKDTSSALNAELEEYRLALSRKYDVPAARVPGITLEE